ncbi:MAG: hypothetical protein NVS4B12_20890 [Ktedonobacteraceae bacterium]
MRQSGLKIVFGPGGLVRDDGEENGELLEQIAKTPALPPSDLLKLAEFYGAYPTNVPLGNHLSAVALTKLLSTRDLQEDLREALKKSTLMAGKPITTLLNPMMALEDIFDHSDDEGPDDKFDLPWARVEVQWIPFSGVGLLIETPGTRGGRHKKHHYVIGVSPDPDSL